MKLSSFLNPLIWAIGAAILIYPTVNDFLTLLADYQNNNIATQITVVTNVSAPSPNITFCLPYHSGALTTISTWLSKDAQARSADRCLECEAMANHSWDAWSELYLTPNEPIEGILASIIVKKLLEETDFESLLTLNKSNFNWNEAIFDSVWKYFACSFIQDVKRVLNTTSELYPRFCDGFDLHSIGRIPRNTTDLLYRRLISTIDVYLKSTVHKEGIANEYVTIKPLYFCFGGSKLNNDGSGRERFVVSPIANDTMQAPWERSVRPDTFAVTEDSAMLHTFVNSFNLVYPKGRRSLSELEAHRVEDVTLAYALEYRVIETRPNIQCGTHTTPLETCLASYQALKATEFCNCTPFSHRHFVDGFTDLPYCNATHYADCEHILMQSLDRGRNICNSRCQHDSYSWKYFYRPPERRPTEMLFRVNITRLTNPFLQFRIVIRDSPEKFLSQVSGIINLYLGFSGMSICALVIYCLGYVKTKLRERRMRSAVGDLEHGNPRGNGGNAKDRFVTQAQLDEVIKRIQKLDNGSKSCI